MTKEKYYSNCIRISFTPCGTNDPPVKKKCTLKTKNSKHMFGYAVGKKQVHTA